MQEPKLYCVVQTQKDSLTCHVRPVEVEDEELRKEMPAGFDRPVTKIVDVHHDFKKPKSHKLQRWLSNDRHKFDWPDPCILTTEPKPDNSTDIYVTEGCTLEVMLFAGEIYLVSVKVLVYDQQFITLPMADFGIESVQLHKLTTSTDTKLFVIEGIKLSSNANIDNFAVSEYIQWYE